MDTSVDLTEEEVRNIIAAFKDMHMRPNTESPDAFKDWIKEFSTQKSLYTRYIPRIPTFFGDNKGDNTYEKPIPAKRTNAPRKKNKNELETVVKQLMSQIELLGKRQEQLINNSKHNRTYLRHQTPDESIAYSPLDMNKRRDKHQKICWRCGQPGHIAIGCKVRLDNSRKFDRAMNYQLVTNENQPTPTTYNKEERICGPANEVSISINVQERIKYPTNISTESVKANCSSIQRQPYVECLAVTAKDLVSKVDTA
ncbi:unnamed protein product [Mytilus coruscus]|uniref:CCHC-type domain-containing protein n=1 Tax=Mytilus coruscus TaxID=42192 RepID=A0A6J8AL00_MYTCO|nr:unnamed protein product [Mytilus coruscus]